MRKDSDRLQDMLEAIEAIEKYVSAGRTQFNSDELVRVWCLRHLEVIGEASARVSEKLRDRFPMVPWREIIGMRNNLIHGYFNVDWDEVWNAVEKDIPKLKKDLRKILETGNLT